MLIKCWICHSHYKKIDGAQLVHQFSNNPFHFAIKHTLFN